MFTLLFIKVGQFIYNIIPPVSKFPIRYIENLFYIFEYNAQVKIHCCYCNTCLAVYSVLFETVCQILTKSGIFCDILFITYVIPDPSIPKLNYFDLMS